VEANKWCEECGQDSHHQPAHYQQVAKEHWDALTPAEREKWEEEAAAKNMQAAASDGSIFELVITFPFQLFVLNDYLQEPEASPHLVWAAPGDTPRRKGRHWCWGISHSLCIQQQSRRDGHVRAFILNII
jgi:hypothetical protein